MLKPQSEEELAGMIAGAEGPLAVQGGGTRGFAGAGEVLSSAGLSGIALYEPGALTLVAGAGTPLAEIKAALAAENQRLAFEPMDHRALLGTTGTPTIGGVMSANVSGPRRIAVGAARDFALGVRFVDGSGRIVKNGGRVMKNVTGYDLVKLLCGSFGTLGVLSEVAMKVLPAPETEASLVIGTTDVERAVAALSRGLGSAFEVTGAAFLPDRGAVVRIEGFEASVAYRLGALEGVLSSFGGIERLDAAASRILWQDVRDVQRFVGRAGDVWRVSVKPSDAPAVVATLPEDADYALDWGGGLIWVLCVEGTDLRARIAPLSGHATLVRADAQVRTQLGVFHPESPALAALTNGVRARFDPRGVLTTSGKMAA
ncbi:FAD-binding protein [Pseudosulfitobacter pseudonitzschiae]|uniref:Glycolate oxidase subunit GlcE n=1 Tax=Pseudosulfitobacter pseudonitzschiae TaxID=1402135 RepID=A0A221K5A9_9RHOB|nr:glycolate oxidase subunit GlcE [Pseudosulfitobacter pseudonitzschiae]